MAFLLLPSTVQTQSAAPVASITANLGIDGGTTGTINTTGANLLVACVSSQGNKPAPQISDSKGNSWTLAASSLGAIDGHTRLFYSVPASVGAGHTFTIGGLGTLASINVMAWAGAAASPLDGTSGAFGTGTSVQPGSVTPAQDNEILITCLSNAGDTSTSSRSINGGFTISGQVGDSTNPYGISLAGAYLVQTTAAATNPTWSYSVDRWANAVIATFKTDEAGEPHQPFGYLGSFRLPDGATPVEPEGFNYGAQAIALDPATGRMFVATLHNKVAEVSMPTPGTGDIASLPHATLVQTFADPFDGSLPAGYVISGVLVEGSSLVVTAYEYYDGGTNGQREGHYRRPKNLSTAGNGLWHTVGDDHMQGHIAGYMAHHTGGMALTGLAGITNIGRTSFGPSAWLFDPTASTDTGATALVDYPAAHQTLGPWDGTSDVFNHTSTFGGVAVINDRLMFVGSHGTGPFCYGEGTTNPALHDTLNEQGERLCYDPTNAAKGPHAYPYRYQFWSYDMSQVLASANPWDLVPDVEEIAFPYGAPTGSPYRTGGMVFDPVARKLYISQMYRDRFGCCAVFPLIHVYHVEP